MSLGHGRRPYLLGTRVTRAEAVFSIAARHREWAAIFARDQTP